MQTKTFAVPNITCGHCVMTIERELKDLSGVNSVKGDETSRQVTVEWDETSLSWEKIDSLLQEINYPPESG